MLFNKILGIETINKEELKVNYRKAVRAVIIKNNNILMVHCNKGDYKFPGGGVDKEESDEEAVKREVEEETGYIVSEVKDKLGIILERNLDEYEENTIFEMKSHYYICEISDKQTSQRLDDYEAELGFCPKWININEAIYKNEEILGIEGENKSSWIYRETLVLKVLKEYLEGDKGKTKS